MDNLPMKKKNSIFSRLKKFFGKENEIYKNTNERNIDKKNFKDDLQKETNIINTKKEILNQVNNNPSIIYKLSDERLEQLIQLYDEKIIEIDENIIMLKKEIAKSSEM